LDYNCSEAGIADIKRKKSIQISQAHASISGLVYLFMIVANHGGHALILRPMWVTDLPINSGAASLRK